MAAPRDPGVRVGIDVASVPDVAASVERFGERYESRVFTARERSDASGHPEVRAARLAARFAAKEAVTKILRPGRHTALPWPTIEVRRDAEGVCTLHLHGEARRLAESQGLAEWAVSLTHHGDVAAAVAAAVVLRGAPAPGSIRGAAGGSLAGRAANGGAVVQVRGASRR